MYVCDRCNYETYNKQSYSSHRRHCKSNILDSECLDCMKKFTKNSYINHLILIHGMSRVGSILKANGLKELPLCKKCGVNKVEISYPNRIRTTCADCKGSHWQSDSQRLSISNSLKLAHKEGRAHNIGMSRWNNEHSYPEKWVIGVLFSEFNLIENEDYKTEFPFHRYSLDFCFGNNICMEIDGEQHDRFQYQMNNDRLKDSMLFSSGWIEYRFKWKWIANNKLLFISRLKQILILAGIIKLISYSN